ncbi:hypothetical protein RRG08_039594 [Elysia crispata]|uniref:Uncharacterized protein n=1 Tax=Elysia crispata TaxID=231223 RepID=A0AAE1DZQ7_9GAST|nr:hypothetical protein RRG08_039594 [Elysia crispata]
MTYVKRDNKREECLSAPETFPSRTSPTGTSGTPSELETREVDLFVERSQSVKCSGVMADKISKQDQLWASVCLRSRSLKLMESRCSEQDSANRLTGYLKSAAGLLVAVW